MHVKETDRKPAVHIYENGANQALLSEICAGLEEEGIPWAISKAESTDAKILAFDAANHSRLRVGIGITRKTAALQIKNCPIEKPIFLIKPDSDTQDFTIRKLGTNAARAVKGGVFV